MKKTFKIFIALFAMILLSCVVAISVTATEDTTEDATASEPNYNDYCFEIYRPKEGTLTKYTDPNLFASVIQNTSIVQNNSIVRLLKDIEVNNLIKENGDSSYMEFRKTKTYYIDLNGNYLSFVRCGAGGISNSMHVAGQSTVYMYSSQPGGRLYNYHTESAPKPTALFYLQGNKATLNLGAATVSEPDYGNVTYNGYDTDLGGYVYNFNNTSKKTTEYSGDNFSVFGAGLIGIVHNTNGIDRNIKVNINGGTYCQLDGETNFILYTSNFTSSETTDTTDTPAELTVKNATLISNSSNKNLLFTSADATGSASFENCVLYADSDSTLLSVTSQSLELSFTECEFIGYLGDFPTGIEFDKCKFAQDATGAIGSTVAKLFEGKTLSLPSHSFTYDSDGNVNPSSYTQKEETVNFALICGTGDSVQITWDAEAILGAGEKVTEKWLIGETPISPIPIPEATSVYRYAFPGVKEVTEMATYTLTGYANFGIKANLTLSDSFAFNIYIPADVWSSVNVDYLKINNATVTATQTKIGDVDYYLVTHPIKANAAKESFTFVINLDGYKETTFEQAYTFSIPDYMERVQSGTYTQEAKDLIDATENYINAVYNYDETKNESNVIDTSYETTKAGTAGKVSGITVQLLLTESIVFSFTATQATDMTFEVPAMENGKFVYKTVKEYGTSCDVKVPVRFLNEGIIITANGNSGTYYIDDYITKVLADEYANQNLKNLVKAIGAYSAAANTYAITEGNQTPIVKFTVADQEITQIVYNSENAVAAANRLKDIIESKTGATLTLTPNTGMSETTNAIRLSLVEPNTEYDYKISVDGTNLVINCSFASFVDQATDYFITDFIKYADKNVNFADNFTEEYFTAKIYYSDFGAVGVDANANTLSYDEFKEARKTYTDDFFAIKATHDFANTTKRHTVYADEGKTYYIHETRSGNEADGYGSVQTIKIKTNVNWDDANFIIDDTDISAFDKTGRADEQIFIIEPDTAVRQITDREVLDAVLDAGFNRETTKIDLGLNEKVMIVPYNSSHKVYRRRGYAQFLGDDMHEVIVIDKDGNVSDETPIMFDYEALDSIEVYSLDDASLTIEGGTFTTRASRIDIVERDENGTATGILGDYIKRGMSVQRSYTTVRNVKHYVTDEITIAEQKEGILGHAYNGFFVVSFTNEVTLEDCVLTGRRCYHKKSAKLDGGTSGSYDFSANTVNKIVLKNCTQSNFWIKIDENNTITPATEDEENALLSLDPSTLIITSRIKIYWGIGGTNYCKNMEYIGSTLSRFDAHCGLYNGKIIDSTVNEISLTGNGDMIIENSRVFSNALLTLRTDYGCTWDGTITLKDVKAYVSAASETYLVNHTYKNWYFGYQACFPSLDITNLDYYNITTGEPLPANSEVYLCQKSERSFTEEPALHLETTINTAPFYPYVDTDGDGYVDETNIEYDGSAVSNSGVEVTDSRVNLNPVRPPETIKITGNDGVNGAGGYIFVIPSTAGHDVSDGGYYDEDENYGGFFGDTKFWYGENDYYLGTDYVGQDTETFKFFEQ